MSDESKLSSSVAEPKLEPQGAKTFGRSWSWSRYLQVSAPAPGWTWVVYFIIVDFEQDQASDLHKSVFFRNKSWKLNILLKSCANRCLQSWSRCQLLSRLWNWSRLRSWSRNFFKDRAEAGAETIASALQPCSTVYQHAHGCVSSSSQCVMYI